MLLFADDIMPYTLLLFDAAFFMLTLSCYVMLLDSGDAMICFFAALMLMPMAHALARVSWLMMISSLPRWLRLLLDTLPLLIRCWSFTPLMLIFALR